MLAAKMDSMTSHAEIHLENSAAPLEGMTRSRKQVVPDQIPQDNMDRPLVQPAAKTDMNTIGVGAGNPKTKDIPGKSLVVEAGNDSVTPPQADSNQEQSDNELSGFIPVKGRTRYTALFASGIAIVPEGVDKTVDKIGVYLERRGVSVKKVRNVRNNDYTVSVKIILAQKDIEQVLGDGFWPNGIFCREWRNN